MSGEQKIKIAFLEEDAKIGGAEVNIFNLIRLLDKSKFDSCVICPCEGPVTERVQVLGGHFAIVKKTRTFSTSVWVLGKKFTNPLALLFNFFSFLPTALRLSVFLKKENIDVLHTNSMLAHFYGALAARVAGSQCLWHIQDIVNSRQFMGLLRFCLNSFGGFFAHRLVAVSESVKSMFNGAAARKAMVVYNGADLEKFHPAISGKEIRNEFKIAVDDIVVGIVGRIVHWKGHKEFLYAASELKKTNLNIKFLIVGAATFGDAVYFETIKKMAKKQGIADSVIFTGFRYDVPEIIAAMDICVHASSLPDPCPLVIFDYMAAGKPIVATKGGGVPEIVVNEETGLLVPMGDSDALKDAIFRIICDPAMGRQMGIAGRKRIENHFSINTFVENMATQYKELYDARV